MQKPIIVSLIISIISLFVIDSFLWHFLWDLWQIVAWFIILIGVWYYGRDHIKYALSQSDTFFKDYIIGVGILSVIVLLYAYDHQIILSFFQCRHYCHIVYESDMAWVFWKYMVIMFFVYTFVFVLQLPEKECEKK